MAVDTIGSLLEAHPLDLIDVRVSSTCETLSHREHSHPVRGMELGAVGDQIDGQQKTKESNGRAGAFEGYGGNTPFQLPLI